MNRLRYCREKEGLSQKQVALEVSVSAPTVSQWESEIKRPDIDHLIQLAKLYHVTLDYLLGLDDIQCQPDSWENLTGTELRLVEDFRSLNKQGKDYILQTMAMSVSIYKNDIIPNVENL